MLNVSPTKGRRPNTELAKSGKPKKLKGCLATPPAKPLTVAPAPPSSEKACLLSNISF